MSAPPASQQGLDARKAALRLLDAVMRRGQPLESALTGATSGLPHPSDRALARAIVSETIRWLPDLDALIDSATRQRLADDAKARMILRMALAQILVMGTPAHAVIATALPLSEGGPRRLIHGVLGALLRRDVHLPRLPALPAGVAARWEAHWGAPMVEDARAALRDPQPIGLSWKDGRHSSVAAGTDIAALDGFAEGAFWVQNRAAAIPACLLGEGGGRRVLDLCAAPGGKTMQLAAAGWDVVAIDREQRRLDRLRENLARTGLAATIVGADIHRWRPEAPVEAILLDAPCSATGIFSRHPDVLHRARPKDIAALAQEQTALLRRAADWLLPGGTLVFATCSLEPEEGEDQVEPAFAAGLAIDPVKAGELPEGLDPQPGGWVRVLPRDGMDGFFAVRFRKPDASLVAR